MSNYIRIGDTVKLCVEKKVDGSETVQECTVTDIGFEAYLSGYKTIVAVQRQGGWYQHYFANDFISCLRE